MLLIHWSQLLLCKKEWGFPEKKGYPKLDGKTNPMVYFMENPIPRDLMENDGTILKNHPHKSIMFIYPKPMEPPIFFEWFFGSHLATQVRWHRRPRRAMVVSRGPGEIGQQKPNQGI